MSRWSENAAPLVAACPENRKDHRLVSTEDQASILNMISLIVSAWSARCSPLGRGGIPRNFLTELSVYVPPAVFEHNEHTTESYC